MIFKAYTFFARVSHFIDKNDYETVIITTYFSASFVEDYPGDIKKRFICAIIFQWELRIWYHLAGFSRLSEFFILHTCF